MPLTAATARPGHGNRPSHQCPDHTLEEPGRPRAPRRENAAAQRSAPRVLASMEPADLAKFLTGNLHWRVTSAGPLIDPALIPSLKVSLAVGKADHFADITKLSRFYDYKGAFEPTAG
ncbi:hypothetical protein B0H63DRAFT_529560 [Podospora didyma]|uniref:Tyrosinase C-terminal domain-containing protein n=1 Tax=Podospora didyma TaxID=330526 RepID=A0AAE0K1E7_9PEZI|nr:hypothetical protein B0H63DRAFT_529560 [Podospora didyma]